MFVEKNILRQSLSNPLVYASPHPFDTKLLRNFTQGERAIKSFIRNKLRYIFLILTLLIPSAPTSAIDPVTTTAFLSWFAMNTAKNIVVDAVTARCTTFALNKWCSPIKSLEEIQGEFIDGFKECGREEQRRKSEILIKALVFKSMCRIFHYGTIVSLGEKTLEERKRKCDSIIGAKIWETWLNSRNMPREHRQELDIVIDCWTRLRIFMDKEVERGKFCNENWTQRMGLFLERDLSKRDEMYDYVDEEEEEEKNYISAVEDAGKQASSRNSIVGMSQYLGEYSLMYAGGWAMGLTSVGSSILKKYHSSYGAIFNTACGGVRIASKKLGLSLPYTVSGWGKRESWRYWFSNKFNNSIVFTGGYFALGFTVSSAIASPFMHYNNGKKPSKVAKVVQTIIPAAAMSLGTLAASVFIQSVFKPAVRSP